MPAVDASPGVTVGEEVGGEILVAKISGNNYHPVKKSKFWQSGIYWET